jgi:rhodanese-related sulfurtransferase
MAAKSITPQEAFDLMQQDSDCVYIDVRTEEEFSRGHPQGAVNIPVASPDPFGGGLAPNDDFTKVVEANFPKEKKLILGCQAGPRSDRAAKILEQAGYSRLFSVKGGFGGMHDLSGKLLAPGWCTLGLPVSQETGEGIGYASLAAKIKR